MKNGKTALVLSGGGSRGAYQIGAWRALEELGFKFDMVVGVSVGALNGAMVTQGEQVLAEHLWRQLETSDIFDVAHDAKLEDFAAELIKQGGAGSHGLQKVVAEYVDDAAMRASDVDFGLLTIEFPALKPNYLWKDDIPEGRLGDYIIASASAFPMVQSYEIDGKDYIDGGYLNVMPIHMAVERGATSVVAIYLKAAGRFDKKELSCCDDITLIQPNFDLGSFLLFDKANTSRMLTLGYYDAMKAFGVCDGERYTFVKGAFDKRMIKQADSAGYVFGLNPLILYRRSAFLEALRDEVEKSDNDITQIQEQFGTLKQDALKPVSLISDLFKSDIAKLAPAELLKQIKPRTAAILIARELKAGLSGTILNSSYVSKLIGDSVAAARFLVRMGLI